MIDVDGVNPEDDEDAEESNANLSNDEAKAEVVIASSPAFSQDLHKYTQRMSVNESFNLSVN